MSTLSRIRRVAPFAIVVALVYVATFLTFEYLFTATAGGSYFHNVVIALLGAGLTVAITSILLAEQTRSEEEKERHVAVFNRMVDRFERMTELLIHASVQRPDDQRQRELQAALHDMALFCSPRTLEVTIRFLEQQRDPSAGEPPALFELIKCFRDDMGLPLDAPVSALAGRLEQTPR